jgi:hypothetical protein
LAIFVIVSWKKVNEICISFCCTSCISFFCTIFRKKLHCS